MRIHVDETKCEGHNRCASAAPGLFEFDEYGYAHEVDDGVVPADQEDKARLAIENCPEQAIAIVGD